MATPDSNHRSSLDRFLGIFADVHSGEGFTALILALNVFLILMAYYILKPVREALILGEGSAELKTYMSAGQVVVLAFVVPLYARLVASRPRMRLINTVTAFFTGCLVVFYFLAKSGVPLAIPFFIWIGVFSLMIVAQFWSFANVIYDKSEGERLFAIVGFGASLGAVFGARIADQLIEPLGINQLLLLGAAVLGTQVLLTNYVDHRERKHLAARKKAVSASKTETAKHSKAFALVFKTRYLLLMARDADAGQLGQHDRRVHPRQHRQAPRGESDCRRSERRPRSRGRSSATSTRSISPTSTCSASRCSSSSCRASSSTWA